MTRASGVCELVYRCLRTRIPVSSNSYTGVVNSYTGVCELVYRCLWTRIPVSVKSYTANTFCGETRLAVSTNSSPGVCELVYRCRELVYRCLWNRILPIHFVGNSSPGVCELVYRCLWTRIPVSVNSYTGVLKLYTLIPVYDFTNTGIRVHRHRYTSSQTPEARVLVFKGHFQVLKGLNLQKSMLKGQFNFFGS